MLIYFLIKFAARYSKLLTYKEKKRHSNSKAIMLYAASYTVALKRKMRRHVGRENFCVWFCVFCVVIMVVSTV